MALISFQFFRVYTCFFADVLIPMQISIHPDHGLGTYLTRSLASL